MWQTLRFTLGVLGDNTTPVRALEEVQERNYWRAFLLGPEHVCARTLLFLLRLPENNELHFGGLKHTQKLTKFGTHVSLGVNLPIM